MTRLFMTWLFAIGSMAWAADNPGYSTPVGKAADGNASVNELTATEPAPAPNASRQVSPDTAAKLSLATQQRLDAMPVFTSQPPREDVAPVAKPSELPRTQVFQMPRFLVRDRQPEIPENEIEVLTPKGRVELAFHRRPGLRFGGPLAWLNRPIALEMLEEDLAVERRAREAELWSLYLVREPAPPQVVSTASAR